MKILSSDIVSCKTYLHESTHDSPSKIFFPDLGHTLWTWLSCLLVLYVLAVRVRFESMFYCLLVNYFEYTFTIKVVDSNKGKNISLLGESTISNQKGTILFPWFYHIWSCSCMCLMEQRPRNLLIVVRAFLNTINGLVFYFFMLCDEIFIPICRKFRSSLQCLEVDMVKSESSCIPKLPFEVV